MRLLPRLLRLLLPPCSAITALVLFQMERKKKQKAGKRLLLLSLSLVSLCPGAGFFPCVSVSTCLSDRFLPPLNSQCLLLSCCNLFCLLAAITESIAVGKPLLGGPWTLVDHTGAVRNSSDFKGKYQLLYFGFTFCPDICPKELEKLAQVIELIGKP